MKKNLKNKKSKKILKVRKSLKICQLGQNCEWPYCIYYILILMWPLQLRTWSLTNIGKTHGEISLVKNARTHSKSSTDLNKHIESHHVTALTIIYVLQKLKLRCEEKTWKMARLRRRLWCHRDIFGWEPYVGILHYACVLNHWLYKITVLLHYVCVVSSRNGTSIICLFIDLKWQGGLYFV